LLLSKQLPQIKAGRELGAIPQQRHSVAPLSITKASLLVDRQLQIRLRMGSVIAVYP